ncbi:MAG: short-chain dehydrogenase [Chloroflexi bacterium 13_1_20CM_4_66_7]|nr:MAG: short-chain dehydrogenase [Chloroflexi bacterium 13_1_20CM_4_66_7]
MELKDRVVVVTGAARGIGRALAIRFASEEPQAVVIADIDGPRLDDVARQIGASAIQSDVSRESDVQRLIAQVESTHGRIDVFCSNAGIAVAGGPEASNDQWQHIWDVNVMSHVLIARHLLPGMLARQEGYIVGTVSAAGLLNHLFAAPYGVTKAAALSFFEWLAIVHGDAGIRVSCLCPQGVKTDMHEAERAHLGINFLTEGALEPEAVADAVIKGIAEERILILSHPEVAEYFRRKADDYDRWLRGMRRLRNSLLAAQR